MHTENLSRDNCGDRQGIECIDETLPCLDVASALTLVIEAVDPRDVGTLVVTTEEKEVFWVFDLVAEKKENRLQRLFTTVDVVAEKEVVGQRREAALGEYTNQVRVLAVDVSNDLHGRGELQERRLQ